MESDMAFGWYHCDNGLFKWVGVRKYIKRFNPKIPKMLNLNYLACKALLKKSEEETPYMVERYQNGTLFVVNMNSKRGILITDRQCTFSKSYLILYKSEYITESSYNSIVDKILEMFKEFDNLC